MKASDPILERISDYHAKLEQAHGTWPAKRELAAAVRDRMAWLGAPDACDGGGWSRSTPRHGGGADARPSSLRRRLR